MIECISLPFHRGVSLQNSYPLKTIFTEEELSAQYDEIIDRNVEQILAKSQLSDYWIHGWQGVCLGDGAVWLDDDGKKIIAVNVPTQHGMDRRREEIERDRLTLPEEYRTYERPLLKCTTKSYVIRVDKEKEGDDSGTDYRLMRLKDEKVDLVLHGGQFTYTGTLGCFMILWLDKTKLHRVDYPIASDDYEVQYSISDLFFLGEKNTPGRELSETNIFPLDRQAEPAAGKKKHRSGGAAGER